MTQSITTRFVFTDLDINNPNELRLYEHVLGETYKLPIIPILGMEIDVDSYIDDWITDSCLGRDVYGICVVERLVLVHDVIELYLKLSPKEK